MALLQDKIEDDYAGQSWFRVDTLAKNPWVVGLMWLLCGMGLIFFNKVIISVWDFPYPFFLTCMHMLYATIATRLLYAFTPLLASAKEGKLSREVYLKKMVLLSLCGALALVLGNSALLHLSVSYIQMLKSCTPVPTFIASFILGREGIKVDWIKMGLIIMISLGAVASSFGEAHWSLVGFILMISAILSDVCRAYCMDYVTKDVKLDALSTLYYMAPLICTFIAIGFFTFEAGHFFSEGGGIEKLQSTSFVVCLFLNASVAMLLNCIAVLFITNVGLMIMSLVGIGKDIAMVGISAYFFMNSVLTPMQVGGYSVSLLGLYLYREHKKDAERLPTLWLELKKEAARQLALFLCCLKIGEGKRQRLQAEAEAAAEYEMVSTLEDAEADEAADLPS